MIRTTLAYAIAPALKLTGLRFSKLHRKNETLAYRCIDVVLANRLADGQAIKEEIRR